MCSSCRYSIDRHTDLERLFSIDSFNGTITTLKALDREMSRWHNISVVATETSNWSFNMVFNGFQHGCGKSMGLVWVSTWFSIYLKSLLTDIHWNAFPSCINLSSLFNVSDNPRQTTRVPVFIKVLDVNDNAPEFAMSYDTFVCENVKAGQVFEF